MASYNELLALIDAYINQNGVQAITGQVLNGVLRAMVDQLGRGYSIMGTADPTTDPGTPDGPESWFASTPGTYTNFDGLTVANAELALLSYTPSDGFSKTTLTQGIVSTAATVDDQVGTPSVSSSYVNGVLTFTFQNMKGNPGDAAGFGTVSASVDGNIGTPGVQVQTSGPNTAKNMVFQFTNLKGETGVTSVVATVDNTSGNPQCAVSLNGQQLTLAFTGLKGAQGDTGSSVDYPFTIVNNLTTNDATKALSAAMGVQLESEVSQLEAELNGWPLVEIDFSDYALVNGYLGNGKFYTSGNYGLYHRCKFIPISEYQGRTIKVVKDVNESQPVTYAVLKTLPDFDAAESNLDFATGYDSILTISDSQSPYEFVAPADANYLGFYITDTRQTWDRTPESLQILPSASNFYNKAEADARFAEKTEGRFGVKWSISDTDDLGTRCFDAVGKTASIGIGNTDGSSDFDSIYPWSEMKRCNIKVNENGAKIVTFEGETGFSTGGSNGDVFVRIPKFCVEKYKEDGYEYRVVSRNQGFVHPAFIENGEELDEIFVAAFEGVISYHKLRSMANTIPTSNETAQTFLDAATAMGEGFTLYDMRSIDAIWTLYAVEYGSRNTNQYFGYGFADFRQPDKGASGGRFDVKEAATNTNSVKVALLNNDYLYWMPIGSNITVCSNTQTNILTQAKITAITHGADYTMFTFDGNPIDVDTDCFVGSAGCTTNFCELCGSTKKLNWHTGRAEFVSGSQKQNPMRYRWIENIFGSLWHFTPDVTLNGLQLYVCDNIKDYQFGKTTAPYRPVGALMTAQTSNGQKNDNTGVNYWIDSLIDDIFAKGITLGKSYDMSLTSQKAFGAFYYANGSGVRINVNGGGFDHDVRCNMLTNRLWIATSDKWYLYGARLMYKNIE